MNARGHRTSSPKQWLAPKPPPRRDCPSPLPKMVSTADVTPADHQGWLIDQLRGRRVWCAVSDMLFCVFEKEDSRVSKQVILLPGCKVKAIEFKSASQDGKILNEVARRFVSKTISGVDKYQFLIENSSNRQKVMFGVPTRQELDAWMEVLESACHVEALGSSTAAAAEEDAEENDDDFTDRNEPSDSKKCANVDAKRDSQTTPLHQGAELARKESSGLLNSTFSPAQTLPPRLDVHALAMPTQAHDISRCTTDHIRRKIRKDYGLDGDSSSSKPSPMRVSHDLDGDSRLSGESSSSGNNMAGKGRERQRKTWRFNIGSPLDLLRRKKRSSSADDAAHSRRKMFPVMDSGSVSSLSLSPRFSDSQPSSLASSRESSLSNLSHDASFSGSVDTREGREKKDKDKKGRQQKKKGGFLSRSWGPEKKARPPLTSSIRRTASDFKEKMFGKNQTQSTKSDATVKSRTAGVKLKDLKEPLISGASQYKLGFKWIKVWCLIFRGCFYAFKSSKKDECPILAVVLSQCCVSYVADSERLPKKMLIFKLTQEHCKPIYICAESHDALRLWTEALQTEAAKVQADECLTAEIKEQFSSRKKKEAKEASTRQENDEKVPVDSGMDERFRKDKKDHRSADGDRMNGSNGSDAPQGREPHPHSAESSQCNTKADNRDGHDGIGEKLLPNGVWEKAERNSGNVRVKKDGGRPTLDKSFAIPQPTLSTSPQLSPSEPSPQFSSSDGKKQQRDKDSVCHFSNDWKFLRPTKRRSVLGQNFRDDDDDDDDDDKEIVKTTGSIYTDSITSPSVISRPSSDFSFELDALSDSPSSTAPSSADDTTARAKADEERVTSFSSSANRRPLSDSFLNQSELQQMRDHYEMRDNKLPRNTFKTSENWKPATSSSSMQNHAETEKKAWTTEDEFLVDVVRQRLNQQKTVTPAVDENAGDFQNWQHTEIQMSRQVDIDDGRVWDYRAVSQEGSNHEPDNVNDDVIIPPPFFQSEDVLHAQEDESEVNDLLITSGSVGLQMDGYLEKRESDNDKWNRYWCVLKGGCLSTYVTPNDETAAGSTDLTGYTVNRLVDKIKEKRFVLHLSHTNYVDIYLSFDSRDEFEVWESTVQMTLTSLQQRQESQRKDSARSDVSEASTGEKMSEVKKKLLAEMLRQKMELEKMQAARKGVKKWSSLDREPSRSTTLPNGFSFAPRSPSSDDNIRALTRLQQRRMSTQIKLQAIRRQMDDKTGGSRERRSGLHLGKKRPDLIQCHDYDPTRQTELEEQVKTLSSTLRDIDSQLSSHGVSSPRDNTTDATFHEKSLLRHSHDSSLFKYSSGVDSPRKEGGDSVTQDSQDGQSANSAVNRFKDKNKIKDKDINRSNSLKSSIQRLAHRTFGRSHWNKVKKSVTSNRKDNNSAKSQEEDTTLTGADGNFASKSRDVIDITAHPDVGSSLDASNMNHHILAPPESFKSEDWHHSHTSSADTTASHATTTPDKGLKKHRTPKERILSKLNVSNSFSSWDRSNSRLKSSSSSPCLYNNNNNNNTNNYNYNNHNDSSSNDKNGSDSINEEKTDLRCTPLTLNSNHATVPVPRLDLGMDSWHAAMRRSSETDFFHGSRSARTISKNGIIIATGNGDVTSVKRPKSGFLSARGEEASKSPKANRNSWSFGTSPRKEVNPNVLAEIQAFEELSNKFLGS